MNNTKTSDNDKLQDLEKRIETIEEGFRLILTNIDNLKKETGEVESDFSYIPWTPMKSRKGEWAFSDTPETKGIVQNSLNLLSPFDKKLNILLRTFL